MSSRLLRARVRSKITSAVAAVLLAASLAGAPGYAATFKAPDFEEVIAQATGVPSTNQIEELTRKTLLKCVELERYNLQYRKTVAKQGRWKGWRYFLTQFGGNSIALSGSIVGTVERGKNFTTFKKLKRKTLEDGNVIAMIGAIVGAAGSTNEFMINLAHDIDARMKGYAPSTARAKVIGLKSDINNLIAERDSQIARLAASGANPKYAALARAEGDVLADVRDISLKEFVDFHCQARRLLTFQQALYVGDVARCVTSACASRFGWRALRYGNRHNNTTSGIFSVVSGSLTVLNPIVARGIGAGVGRYQRHYVKDVTAGIQPGRTEALTKDLGNVKTFAADNLMPNADLPILRAALYAEHEQGIQKQLALRQREVRAGNLAAAENVCAGAFIGGNRIASGVLFLVAGIDFRRSSRHTNILLGTSNILNCVGTGFGAIDNVRIQVKREITTHKLAKKGQTAGHVINARLENLNKIEKSLSAPIADTNRISSSLIEQATFWSALGNNDTLASSSLLDRENMFGESNALLSGDLSRDHDEQRQVVEQPVSIP
jgi:hypothetical protein